MHEEIPSEEEVGDSSFEEEALQIHIKVALQKLKDKPRESEKVHRSDVDKVSAFEFHSIQIFNSGAQE